MATNLKHLLTIPKAAVILGVSKQALTKRIKRGPLPGYVLGTGRATRINIKHAAFKSLIIETKNNKLEQPRQGKKKVLKKKSTKKKTTKKLTIADYEKKLDLLRFESLAAKMQLPIQKAELNAYKIEQEKITLGKESRRLIEFELASFLFLGYIERANREALNFPKRVEREIDLVIQGGIHAGHDSHNICKKIIKIILRELEAILKDIVKEQKKDVDEWESGE